MKKKRDHYATLNVPKDADAEVIKRAYREKAKQVHPDTQSPDANAFLELQRAYDTLSDQKRRHTYDETGDDGDKKPIDSKEVAFEQAV